MKAGAFFAGRSSHGNSWSWDFRRGGAEKQIRTGRKVVQKHTRDVGTVEGVDVDHDVALIRWADGDLGWTPCKDLEVTP
jgi:hypothetical protein